MCFDINCDTILIMKHETSPNQGCEFNLKKEYSPTPGIVDILKGEISELQKTKSQKNGSKNQEVEVRIVEKGPGMIDLNDWKDNKEWSGIFNHVLLCARYASYFAEELSKKGHNIDPQTVLDAMLVSHTGRRQWDEANWYPEIAPNSAEKRSKPNEQLGLELIKDKVQDNVYNLVAALGYEKEKCPVEPKVYDTLEYKIASYVDHRTTGKYEPLNVRMGNFVLQNFLDKDKINPELKEKVYGSVQEIINNDMSFEEADKVLSDLGAPENSPRLPRKILARMIVNDANTEKFLQSKGVNTEINDDLVPMPKWEDELRKRYVLAAKEEIIENKETILKNSESDKDNWWNKYVEKYFDEIKNERTNLY